MKDNNIMGGQPINEPQSSQSKDPISSNADQIDQAEPQAPEKTLSNKTYIPIPGIMQAVAWDIKRVHASLSEAFIRLGESIDRFFESGDESDKR